jgi:hypothetical protein
MNEQKYLIVECSELSDGWECDADRKPLGITNNISMWNRLEGYEIYEIKSNGKLEIVKYYDEGDLHIATSSRLTRYIVNDNNSYVCDLTDEMKILFR